MKSNSRSAPSSTSAKLDVAAAILRLGAYTVWDRLRHKRPRDLSAIPFSIEVLTPEWLTAVLCGGHPGARVDSFERGSASTGSTSREALRIRYNDAGRSAGLPERVFAKATPRFTSRMLCALAGALACEYAFYTRLRCELDIEAPPPLHASYDQASGRSMFLFEDIASTRGCRFLNTEALITRAQAEDMVTLLARLHGRYWESPRLDAEFTWLKTSADYMADITRLINFKDRSLIGLDRARAVVPRELLARRDELWSAVLKSLEMNSAQPRTYLHHDVHIGNWYCTGEGRMGLTDWQCNVKGQWASDVAYALTSALQVEDRRAWERDLIRLYIGELARTGAPAPSFDAAWLQYRQQPFHGLAFWLYTLGHGPLQPEMQPDDFSLANIHRMTNAIVDLDSMDSLS
jgi:hypothetical protein